MFATLYFFIIISLGPVKMNRFTGVKKQQQQQGENLYLFHLGVFLGDVLQFGLGLRCHLLRCLEFLIFLTHFFFLSGDLQQGLHLNHGQTHP